MRSRQAGGLRLRDVVTSPERQRDYIARGFWDGTRLTDRLRSHAARTPDAVAVVEGTGGRRATFAELERDSGRVASLLVHLGVEPGDVVALQLPNRYASVAIALGVHRAGAVVNPMLPAYRTGELRHMLSVARTRLIVTPDVYREFDHVRLVGDLRDELPDLRDHLVIEDREDGLERFVEGGPAAADDRALPASAVTELMFTSGTEAEPKAIMHTERTLNANARATWTALGMTPDDSVWMPAPIGHSTGYNHGLRMAVYHGLKLVLQDRWDAPEGAALIEAERCSHTLLSTTFLRDLTQAVARSGRDVSSLRLFGCGGAPIPPEAVREAYRRGIGCLRLYGATEVLVATWNRPDSPWDKRVETEGLPLDGVEIEVRDDEGRSVVGEPGELFTRGPCGSTGFFADPDRTAATFSPDGWVRSGDLGVIDADGYFSMSGRRKEIIIRGGMNIAPREVEDLIFRLPEVRAVAVVAIPHDRLGETSCACVMLEPGSELTLERLTAHLREGGLAVYKLPERLEIVAEMPTTATGKIRKHLLVASILEKDTAH